MSRRLSLEVVVDVVWVVLAGGYVAIAQTYPPDSRLAPTVAGGTALVVGLVQLLGNLHGGLRRVTHGEPPPVTPERSSDDRRQVAAIAYTVGLLVGVYVLGFLVGIPLFILLYFLLLYRRGWRFAVVSSAAVLVFVVLVVQVLGVHLPNGLIWDSLVG